MWTETKVELKEVSRNKCNFRKHVLNSVLLFTGDMLHMDKYIQDMALAVRLMVSGLRGVSRVTLANNPLSGVLILAALYWSSPWQCMLGTLGVLVSTLTAFIIGQDSAEVLAGHHAFNGMLVSLLMGVFNLAGDWYWWLLLPACLGSATCVFLSSGLTPLLDCWDLPVSVFPFNLVFILYLLCTGPNNPYFPHYPVIPPGALEVNSTELSTGAVLHGILLGVGQIYACEVMGPSLLILGAVFLYSPLLAIHAVIGSAVGTLAGLSVAVHHDSLYSGLSGFNGALGCMTVGGLFFTFNWRTHLFAVACAFLSTYVDIALGNLLGTVGLPACSLSSTLITTLMLLLNGHLSVYRIPTAKVMAPEHNLISPNLWESGKPEDNGNVIDGVNVHPEES